MSECDKDDCIVVDGFNNQQKYVKELKQELEELKETFAKVNSSFLEEFALAKKEGRLAELKEVLGRLEAHNRNCLINNPRECLKLEIKTIKEQLKVLGGK